LEFLIRQYARRFFAKCFDNIYNGKSFADVANYGSKNFKLCGRMGKEWKFEQIFMAFSFFSSGILIKFCLRIFQQVSWDSSQILIENALVILAVGVAEFLVFAGGYLWNLSWWGAHVMLSKNKDYEERII
jgi:hypothetical protein